MWARAFCARVQGRSAADISTGSEPLIRSSDRPRTTTMNHSDIRGLVPHDHDSSGAASVQEREFETEVIYRIERARILLSTSADQITGSARPRQSR